MHIPRAEALAPGRRPTEGLVIALRGQHGTGPGSVPAAPSAPGRHQLIRAGLSLVTSSSKAWDQTGPRTQDILVGSHSIGFILSSSALSPTQSACKDALETSTQKSQ